MFEVAVLGMIALTVWAMRQAKRQARFEALETRVDKVYGEVLELRSQFRTRWPSTESTTPKETSRPAPAVPAPTFEQPITPSPEPPVAAEPDPRAKRMPVAAPVPRTRTAPPRRRARASGSFLDELWRALGIENGEHLLARLNLESHIGSRWTVRLGLVTLALGMIMLADLHDAGVDGWVKTCIMLTGAAGMYAAGSLYERRLQQFARPVLAGGLVLLFFTALGAHFLEQMRCIGLWHSLPLVTTAVALLGWYAQRWRMQLAAGVTLCLGFLAAVIANGHADLYACAMVGAVACAGAFLTLSHRWVYTWCVTTFGVYLTFAAWFVHAEARVRAAESAPAPLFGILAFASLYFAILAVMEVRWWRARSGDPAPAPRLEAFVARAASLGNLLLFPVLVMVLYTAADRVGELHRFLFPLAAVLVLLGRRHRLAGNTDYELFGATAVAVTLVGLFTGFTPPTTSLLLAGAAVALLVLARATGYWSLHAFAWLTGGIQFVHYWVPGSAPVSERIGVVPLSGALIVVLWLLYAWLAERWYGERNAARWRTLGAGGPVMNWLGLDFRRRLIPLTPYLSRVYALVAAGILMHQVDVAFTPAAAYPALAIAAALMTPVLVRAGGGAVLVAYAGIQAALAAHAIHMVGAVEPPDPWTTWAAAAVGALSVVMVASAWPPHLSRLRVQDVRVGFRALSVTLVSVCVSAACFVWRAPTDAPAVYLMWIVLFGIICLTAELTRTRTASVPMEWLHLSAAAALAMPVLVWIVTFRFVDGQVAGLFWLLPWYAVLTVAGILRRSPVLLFAGVGIIAGQTVYTWADSLQRESEMLQHVPWWYLGAVWTLALAVIWTAPRRFTGAMARYTVLAGQGVILVGLGTAFVIMYSLEPPAVGRYLQWMGALSIIFLAQERARVTGNTFAFGPEVVVTSVCAALAVWGFTSRVFPEPIIGVMWLAAFTLVLVALAVQRRALGLYAGGMTLLIRTQFELYSHQPVPDGGSGTPVLTVLVVAMLLGTGLVQEAAVRIAGDRLSPRWQSAGWALAAVPLGLAMLLLYRFVEAGVQYPWALPTLAVAALALLAFAWPVRFSASALVSALFLASVAAAFLRELWLTPWGAMEPARSAFLFLCVFVLYERVLAARGFYLHPRGSVSAAADGARIMLMGLVCAVVLFAVFQSPLYGLGQEWVTLGWAAIGAALMLCGFSFGSALYRRAGLGVTALCLARVYAVDLVRMGDVAKSVTFIAVAVCLMAYGWLYARFAGRVESRL